MTGYSDAAVEPIETAKPDDLAKWTAGPPRIGKRLHTVGFWITGVWLLLVAAYVIADFAAFKALEPNALGDFAAGAAAPLAFLWLVLGFFQQGEELRHSADALWLQGRELQNSVEQQRELVNVTREQLKFESDRITEEKADLIRNAQPILEMSVGGNGGGDEGRRTFFFRIHNHGKPCTKIAVEFHNGVKAKGADVLPKGGGLDFTLQLHPDRDARFGVKMSYLDERHYEGAACWDVTYEKKSFRFMPVAQLPSYDEVP